MSSHSLQSVECVIIGAGPVGCCLALFLASEGLSCEVIDWRSEESIRAVGQNRSHNTRGINLGLSARGLSALAAVGLKEEILAISVKMLGRIVHLLPSEGTEGQICFQRYGSSDSHFVCSVDRDDVNKILFEKCLKQKELIHFSLQHKVLNFTIEGQGKGKGKGKGQSDCSVLTLKNLVDGSIRTLSLECPVFGCDGASSTIRQEIFRFLPSKDEQQLPDLLHWQNSSSTEENLTRQRGNDSDSSRTTASESESPKLSASRSLITLSSPPRRMRENSFSAQQIIQSSPLSPKLSSINPLSPSKNPLSPLSPSSYLPGITWSRKYLDYGYKALLLDVNTEERKDMFLRNGIHIWPRSHFLAIGPPHIDNKINFLLFLPLEEGGDEKDRPCFRRLTTEDKVLEFFSIHFSDLKEFHTELVQQFMSVPIGTMSSVTCSEWFFEDRVLLLGDSAHAIVPFLGQGLNAGLQDCEIFIRMFREKRASVKQNSHQQTGKFCWAQLFNEFTSNRFVDVESVSLMTLETFLEMRDQVGSAEYIRKKSLESKLQQWFPSVFLSRYSLVTFHTIPYSVAYEAGLKSMHIVETLLGEGCSAALIESQSEWRERALKLIQSYYYPYIQQYLEQEAQSQQA